MPLPVVLGAIFGGLSFLTQAAATIHGVASAENERRRRREIAEYEAQRVEGQIHQVLEDTEQVAQDFRLEGGRIRGRQVLAYARSGVRLSGSPLLRLQETRDRIEEGSRRIMDRGERTADQLRSQARAIRLRGETGLDPGAVAISALPGLVSSGLSFADSIYNALPPQPSPPAQPALAAPATPAMAPRPDWPGFRNAEATPSAQFGVGVSDDIRY